MSLNEIPKGFDDPVFGAQENFRVFMDGFSHPGTINQVNLPHLPASPLAEGTAAFALSLFDFSTPVWFDHALDEEAATAKRYLQFHTNCPITENADNASFAIINGAPSIEKLSAFAIGSPEYPDRSTTLLIQVDGLSEQDGITLRGPGIENQRKLNVSGVDEEFWQFVQRNNALFPLGLDFIFVSQNRFACLPRSTRVEI